MSTKEKSRARRKTSSYMNRYNVNSYLEYVLLSAVVALLLGGTIFVVVGCLSYLDRPWWRANP